jgi:hypothetical protein
MELAVYEMKANVIQAHEDGGANVEFMLSGYSLGVERLGPLALAFLTGSLQASDELLDASYEQVVA